MSNAIEKYINLIKKDIKNLQASDKNIDKDKVLKDILVSTLSMIENQKKQVGKTAVKKPATAPKRNRYYDLNKNDYESESDDKNGPAKVGVKFLVPKHEPIVKAIRVKYDPFAKPIVHGNKKFGSFHEHLFDYNGKKICDDVYFYIFDKNGNPKIFKGEAGIPKKYKLVMLKNNANKEYTRNVLATYAIAIQFVLIGYLLFRSV